MLDRGDPAGTERLAGRQGGDEDVDQPFRAVQPAPEIVVLTVGAAEECAEAVELNAFQRRLRAALADRSAVIGRNAIDRTGSNSSSPSPWSSGKVATS